jgi:pimeloyl-ACP methyl ester carboxylesterase
MNKLVFSILIIASCNNSKTRYMSVKNETPQTKQDSIIGYAPVNGIKMYYEIHGEGTPLVLVHGGGSTIQTSFGRILPILAQHYNVIAVELQAHGHTNDRDAPESFQQDADDVAELLKHLKINKAHILGFSNGGQTSMQLAISHPALINKLVIVSAFYKREGAIPGFFDSMPNATLDNMPAPLRTAYLQVNDDQEGLIKMFTKDRDRMVNFQGWSDDQLKSIRASTFIIAGDQDVVTPEHAMKMSQLIPNAQLMILPGNHGSFIGEICSSDEGSKIPEMTVGVIEEFLDKKMETKKGMQ